jgi:hypothetical protein
MGFSLSSTLTYKYVRESFLVISNQVNSRKQYGGHDSSSRAALAAAPTMTRIRFLADFRGQAMSLAT